ncbi:MAG: GNAT family N-acetyltransferase [Candidatus Thorarchaeota archaeon]|nr:GNAT family N-acetyltransferase [Candidatus Thorarchaeota archaeon]
MNSSGDIRVTRAQIEDARILAETCKRAFDSDLEVGAPGPGGPPGYDSVEWNGSRIVNPYLQYYKILKGETIVGGFIAGDRGLGYQVCERIWVDPDHMREGIGQRTFEIVWEGYPQADLWTLGTPEWNVRTNPFYQKLGFVKIGTTHEYPHWSGNYYEKSITNGFPRAMSTIEALRPGLNQVVVEGLVETMQSPRTVFSRKTGEELKVVNAILRDGTGSIRLVLWNDQIRQVKEHSRIRLENGYVREYRDDIQLGVGEWGVIITLVSSEGT